MSEARRPIDDDAAGDGLGRRTFLGWLIAAPTLVVGAPMAAQLVRSAPADAAVPSPPEPADVYDLSDFLTDCALPTSALITVGVHSDGTVSFALPRAEVGQGITTSTAMIIADELDIAVSKVHVTLADAEPKLVFNQITGGSNTTHAMYNPIRTAAALARGELMLAAAARWAVPLSELTTRDGVVHGPSGRKASYGSLATAAASATTTARQVTLKPAADLTIVGKPYNRVDARDAVTGRKVFAMDLKVANALPTMIHRAPFLNGTVKTVKNLKAVRAMPGITDVGVVSTGVAVRGRTFGQCIDAVRALKVEWHGGTVDQESDASVLAKLKAAELPMAVPDVPVLATTTDHRFTFYFRSNSPLETNCAVADVRKDSAVVWASLKNPIVTQQTIAQNLGLPQDAVKVHVLQGGGSFGRHLFGDYAYEAAEASKLFGKPVRLMWHRTDDFRHGRAHPMCTSRIRTTTLAGQVLTFEQRHTSVATDFTHGLGEMLTAFASKLPGAGDLTFSESIFELSTNVPYNYGVTTQLLNEIFAYDDFHTGSMRNVYSPDTCTATELVTDELAKSMGKDPVAFRLEYAKDDRMRAVIRKAASVGRWGRSMAAGTAQGLAIHSEYKGRIACLVEIDCRPATVNRKIEDAYTGPRVTKVVIAVDVGKVINPRGLEAQMMGGAMDGIAQTLTSSLHLENGIYKEGSWDNYWYTRQWNVPPVVQIEIMPDTTGDPGGAGEFGCGVTQAAVACAYARAVGRMPTEFPINHNKPLGFEPLPTVPPIPQSPTNGLAHTF